MNKTTVHPDAVLEALLEKGARSNKISNLMKLHEICRRQYESQNVAMRDFGLSSIGRLCEAQGVFKARVLYNAASEDYVTLITAWAAFSGPASVKAPKESKGLASYEYLMRIQDPAIRSIMQAAISERDNLRAQLNLLKSKTIINIDQRPLGATLASEGTGVSVPVLLMSAQLTDSERKALTKAISKNFLDQEGWSEGSYGEIINKSGRTIFDVGFAVAIRKVLGE